ncbi:hypothetical protein ACFFHJ_14070 [Planotetraspora thailandica]|nr:hypothetical protein [Planotetraspora thailandica]
MRIFNKIFIKPAPRTTPQVSYLETLATNARHSRTRRPFPTR